MKKILVLANNCFSKTSSNGRTLANFFLDYPKECLAQFYIHGDVPDFETCDNYYRVSDDDVIANFKTGKAVGAKIEYAEIKNDGIENIIDKRRKKTPFTILVRDYIWNRRKWADKNFYDWIDDFGPEVILLQAGDNRFMFKLAVDLSESRKIPLAIYNSEYYYFKKKNYMRRSGFWSSLLYPLYYSLYKKQFERTMKRSSHCIYICDSLKAAYDKLFDENSTALYTSSSLRPLGEKPVHAKPVISYLGNLGIDRYKNLVEIANALSSIDKELKLNVYGKIPCKDAEDAFNSCEAIDYKGFVTYDKVVEIMHNSDLLIHTEYFSDFNVKDLEFAFSTKIADCLSCGTCLFYYGPRGIESTEYLLKNDCAAVVSEKDKLIEGLREILYAPAKREEYVKKALEVSNANHNAEANARKFMEIMDGLKVKK